MCCRSAGCRVDPHIAGLFVKEEVRGRGIGRKPLWRAENRKKAFSLYVQGQSKGMAVLPLKRIFRRKGSCLSGYGRGRKADDMGQTENRGM
ncbi:hypothetical protein DW757_16325 [Clostridium sp. AM29-11AC]|nr:hypothetical protein DW757_16325 [Clostridium sp. AM29-11AC]